MAEHDLLADYMPDEDYQRLTKRGARATARERASGRGPTFIRLGRKIYYYIPGVEEHLTALQVKPVRKPQSRRSPPAAPEARR